LFGGRKKSSPAFSPWVDACENAASDRTIIAKMSHPPKTARTMAARSHFAVAWFSASSLMVVGVAASGGSGAFGKIAKVSQVFDLVLVFVVAH
jgi:hypothetical protein